MRNSQKETDWRDSFLVPVCPVCLAIFSDLRSGGVVRPMALEKLSKVVLVVSNQSRNHREYRKIVSCSDLHRSLWLPLIISLICMIALMAVSVPVFAENKTDQMSVSELMNR